MTCSSLDQETVDSAYSTVQYSTVQEHIQYNEDVQCIFWNMTSFSS